MTILYQEVVDAAAELKSVHGEFSRIQRRLRRLLARQEKRKARDSSPGQAPS